MVSGSGLAFACAGGRVLGVGCVFFGVHDRRFRIAECGLHLERHPGPTNRRTSTTYPRTSSCVRRDRHCASPLYVVCFVAGGFWSAVSVAFLVGGSGGSFVAVGGSLSDGEALELDAASYVGTHLQLGSSCGVDEHDGNTRRHCFPFVRRLFLLDLGIRHTLCVSGSRRRYTSGHWFSGSFRGGRECMGNRCVLCCGAWFSCGCRVAGRRWLVVLADVRDCLHASCAAVARLSSRGRCGHRSAFSLFVLVRLDHACGLCDACGASELTVVSQGSIPSSHPGKE